MNSTEMLAPNDETIVAIEYQKEGRHGWKPFSVITFSDRSQDQFDFDWCERPGYSVYHLSGCGPIHNFDVGEYVNAPDLCSKLWLDTGRIKPVIDGQPATAEEVRARGTALIKRPLILKGGTRNPFEMADVQEGGHTDYCIQCKSYYPDDSTCRHLQYEDSNGNVLGCGSGEVDFEQARASLFRFLRLLPQETIETLLFNLMSPKFHTSYSDSMLGGNWHQRVGPKCINFYLEPLGEELEYEERYWPGIAWLQSLDKDTKVPRALTAGWVYQFQHESWNNSLVLGRTSFIRELPGAELDEWLALDPQDPSVLHDRSLKVKLGFKTQSAHDAQFLQDPEKTPEVILWRKKKDRVKGNDGSLVLSVAEVKRIAKKEVAIYFGRVIERNGVHISKLDDYDIC